MTVDLQDNPVLSRSGRWAFLVSGPLFGITLFAGFLISGFFPPLAPSLTRDAIVAYYLQHSTAILVGQSLPLLASPLLALFCCQIVSQLRRIRSCPSELLAANLVLTAVIVVFFMLPSLMWIMAAYRPDRDPDVLYAMHDMATLFLIPPIGPFALQPLLIGIAILTDRSSDPLFPRWTAYMNFWVAALFMPDCLAVFFKHGPFAWNGLFAFWIPGFAFGLWLSTMCYCLYRATLGSRAVTDRGVTATA